MKDELWTTQLTRLIGNIYWWWRIISGFFGNFVLIYILDMGMREHRNLIYIWYEQLHCLSDGDIFSCFFFGNAILKMFVCRSTVITFLKECQQMN